MRIVLKTVKEGAFLYNAGINPYSGDMYHENPLILVASSWLLNHCSHLIPLLFISIDLLVAMLLYFMAKRFTKEMVCFSLPTPKIDYEFLLISFIVPKGTKRHQKGTLLQGNRRAATVRRRYHINTYLRGAGVSFQSIRRAELRWNDNHRLE